MKFYFKIILLVFTIINMYSCKILAGIGGADGAPPRPPKSVVYKSLNKILELKECMDFFYHNGLTEKQLKKFDKILDSVTEKKFEKYNIYSSSNTNYSNFIKAPSVIRNYRFDPYKIRQNSRNLIFS